jgi:hypothetical protein
VRTIADYIKKILDVAIKIELRGSSSAFLWQAY